MPRERTLDERVRALERSVDAATGTSRSSTTDTPLATANTPTGSSSPTDTVDVSGAVGAAGPVDGSPGDGPGTNEQQNSDSAADAPVANRGGNVDSDGPMANRGGSAGDGPVVNRGGGTDGNADERSPGW